jgi:molybdate transport system permease protein
VNSYPIATLAEAANPQAAQAFVDLVAGPAGREVLAAAGFRRTVIATRRPGGPIPVGVPAWIYLPATVGALFVIAPLIAILLKIDWPRFIPLITSESSRTALVLSLQTATASTAVCVLLGVPMAVVLARGSFPAGRVLRALVTCCRWCCHRWWAHRTAVLTFAGRACWGSNRISGSIRIRVLLPTRVLAQSFVSLPFLVVQPGGPLRSAGQGYEHVAATLVARPTTVLRTVTLPLVLPGLASPAGAGLRPSLASSGRR